MERENEERKNWKIFNARRETMNQRMKVMFTFFTKDRAHEAKNELGALFIFSGGIDCRYPFRWHVSHLGKCDRRISVDFSVTQKYAHTRSLRRRRAERENWANERTSERASEVKEKITLEQEIKRKKSSIRNILVSWHFLRFSSLARSYFWIGAEYSQWKMDKLQQFSADN